MNTFTLIPVLGLKTNVPLDDPTLLKTVGENTALSYHTDGQNIDFARKRGACSKSFGKAQWSNSAITTTLNCLGMFELYDGSNRSFWTFMGDNGSNGRIFRFDNNRDPVRISDVVGHSGATEWASGDLDLYNAIQYGSDMVFTDFGEHTPYFADNSDTTVAKMISSGTEYKCRYLELFSRRIIMAYTDQTNGDIEIRYSDALPTLGSMSIPVGNQLFKPGNDSITGIKKYGSNACFLYSEDSIDSIDYYPNYVTPFAINNMVSDQGTTNHHSIVQAMGSHFFYNKNYGFCEYRGGPEFPYGGRPISYDIEDKISLINSAFAGHIVGVWYPLTKEICWTVPLNGAALPTHLLFYNPLERQWRIEDRAMRYIDAWSTFTTMTWNDLITELGGAGAVWTDASTSRWAEYTTEAKRLMMSNEDGLVYQRSSEGDAGSALDGYRVEPVLNLAGRDYKSLVNEIWIGLVNNGSWSIDLEMRQGDTVAELEDASWTSIGSISANDPSDAKVDIPLSMAIASRYHQIKWGTDAASEAFAVNRIIFKHTPQGQY